MKKLLLAVILLFSGVVFAQVHGVHMFNPRTATWSNPVGYPPMGAQMIPVPSQSGMFMSNGNTYRCPALAGWGGGLIGALVGGFIGNRSTFNDKTLGSVGVILGATAGNQIACEYAQQNTVNQPVQAHRQVSQNVASAPVAINSVKVASSCNMDGIPALQNLQGLTLEQCVAIAAATGTKVTKEEAKQTSKEFSVTPRDNVVRVCKFQHGPDTPVLAVSVLDPGNPSWRLVPSKPGETCQEWKLRIV